MSEIRVPSNYPSPAQVADRRVVVTGGSRGLGRLLVDAFARSGALVLAVARGVDDLEQTRDETDGKVEILAGDVSDPAFNELIVDRSVELWGGLDVWIANAGISPVVAPAAELDPEVWRRVIGVNLDAVFYGVRPAVRVLGEGGRIIVTASVLGIRPRRGLHAYNASKAGVIALVRGLAVELADRGVTANAVAPGWFESPLAEGWMRSEQLAERTLNHTPAGRLGRSEDLPGAYLFLASRASDYVTGSVLTVDGGYLSV